MTTIHHSGEMKSNEWRDRLDRVTGRAQRTRTPSLAVIERAEGCALFTVDGRRLIDMASGVLVANLGHNHDGFERRYQDYVQAIPRTSYNMVTPVEVMAAERLLATMESSKAEKVLWAASGSEGVQKAMWCALHKHPERPLMVATRHGFHGKKGLAGDVSGERSPNPNVRFISFPMEDEHTRGFCEAELEALGNECADRIALLITEPYLGAAGSYHPPKWYHQLLQRWCETHDIAFIFDEVQSCHGRTGNMYAFESYGIQPDLVVLGKGLGNGEPVAAVAGRADLIDALDYGEASDTFGGNPHACAAVCAVLDVFAQDDVVARGRAMAPVVRARLEALVERFSFVTAVRGEGLVFGLELASNALAEDCVREAYYGDGNTGVHFLGPLAGKVLRVSPPLVISEDEVDEAFALLNEAWSRIETPVSQV